MESPNYYAVIPADVRYCRDLSAGEKLLFGEIAALCNKNGECWATNGYFADLYGVDCRTVTRWITKLTKLGFIESTIKDSNTRHIKLGCDKNVRGGMTKMSGGGDKNVTRNNINNNNINNNTQDCSNTLESVVCNNTHARAHEPPTPKLEDVLAYAKQQNEFAGVGGYKITKYVATRFYDYYTATGWRNKNNMPIVDWRAQLRLWASDVRHQEKPEKLDKPVKLW